MAFEKGFFGPMGQSEQKEYSTGGLIAVKATWHLP